MRYSVHLAGDHVEHFDSLPAAADCAIDDPEGSKLAVHDHQEQRWVSGAELLLAYVTPRKKRMKV